MSIDLEPIVDTTPPALCTREQVKARIDITTAHGDAQIDALIATVLPTVCTRYGREFMPWTTATRYFDVRSNLVDLTGSDLRHPTSIVLDPDDKATTLGADDYILRPCFLTDTYTAVKLSSALALDSDYARKFGVGRIAITGDWGIWATTDDVPLDIQEAAIECVLSWMDRPVADLAAIDSANPRGMMPAVQQAWDIPISAYRKFMPYSRNLGVY